MGFRVYDSGLNKGVGFKVLVRAGACTANRGRGRWGWLLGGNMARRKNQKKEREDEQIEKISSNILDFKQVFQFDSPQIFQILKIFRKMQARYKIFKRMTFFLTVFYHMLPNCSF